MKRAYILHGWGADSSTPWIVWAEEELRKKGFEVHSFDMPNTDEPKIEDWVKYIEENAPKIDENTYFIGHSIGAQTIMRFLEKSHKHIKVGGCVFIAPWLDLIGLGSEELKIAHPWLNNKINPERVLDHTGKITCIFSTNDPYVSPKEWKKFEEDFGAKVIIKKDFGHFEETKIIPEILENIK
ncbi:MAG: alpha/beta fold hydrolase [Nanoarchaeota archaeon]|nr:alpha/beta fold hydrolase [Nanoarchaeota archaeon]